jgi:hypothetical protein
MKQVRTMRTKDKQTHRALRSNLQDVTSITASKAFPRTLLDKEGLLDTEVKAKVLTKKASTRQRR